MLLIMVVHLVVDIGAMGWESSGQAVGGLALEQDQLRGRRVVKDALEVHCIINLILGLKDFLELEVIMTIPQCIEVNVTIVLPI